MFRKKIMILGASRYYSRCIEGARAAGYYVFAVDRNPDSDGFTYADESFVCDIINHDKVLRLATEHCIDGIVPTNDFGVPTAAFVADYMGLKGISSVVAELATNKEVMRRHWIRAGLPCPKIAIAERPEDFDQAISEIGLPCILKPAHGIGGASRGVIVIEQKDKIAKAIEFSQQFYNDKTTLVEEFIKAEHEHSAEVLIHGGKAKVIAISDKLKTPLPYRVDKAVLYPTCLEGTQLQVLKRTIVDSVLALGIKEGAAHVELASTSKGPVLFELGARCGGGGTANPIVKYSTGVDLFTENVRILAGDEPLNWEIDKNLGCCYYFITPQVGEVMSVTGINDINACDRILDADILLKAGDKIKQVTYGTERSGFLISTGKTGVDAYTYAQKIEKLLYIRYKN